MSCPFSPNCLTAQAGITAEHKRLEQQNLNLERQNPNEEGGN